MRRRGRPTARRDRRRSAQTLRNPDLEPGIRLHFDIGVNPPATAPEDDFGLYGNWGGHNWVPPVCGGDGCKRADADSVWRQQMHANRHGVFHYLGGYPSGGGQAPPHSVANGIPLDSMGVAAHELGHTLGLGHNGPFDGEALDANCKPTYPSLMSYAYLDRGYRRFSDGYGRAAINNTSLQEQYAISNPTGTPGSRYLENLRDYFNYTVDMTNGHVDWNRDGTFQSASAPVRAYANNNGGGCEFTKYNRVELDTVSQRAPALVRLGDMTVMLSIAQDRTIVFEYTTDSLACPAPTGEGCGAAPQRASMGQSWNQRIDAIDAHRVVENGVAKLLIVYRTLGDELFEVTFTPWTFGTPRRIATATTPEAELSLAGNSAVTYLAYRGADGRPVLKVRSSVTKEWAADEPVADGSGALESMGAGTSPSLLEVVAGGQRTLYGVFASSSNDLRLYTFDTSTRVWTRSTWVMDAEAIGKPAMAWVGLPPDSVLPGRLHLAYLKNSASGKTVVKDLMLRARYYDANVLELGMYGGEHQNAWLYGYGLDLLYEPGVDTNLRLLLARKRLDDNDVPYASAVELRPKADGIVDFDQRNWNDWEVLRVDLCRTLVGSVSGSIRCPSWVW